MIYDNKDNKKNAWMLSFVDLLSIILAFFILLYSLSGNIPKKKSQREKFNFSKSDFGKNKELLYLKNLFDSKIYSNIINITSIVEKDQFILNLLSQNLFEKNEPSKELIYVLKNFSGLFKDYASNVYIKYEHKNDKFAFPKLFEIKNLMEKYGFRNDIEIYASNIQNKTKLDEKIIILITIPNYPS